MTTKKIIESEIEKVFEEMTDGYLFSYIPDGMDWNRIFMGGLDEKENEDEKKRPTKTNKKRDCKNS